MGMKNYITIDGGTTNTRISLVQDGRVTDTLKFAVGARMGIENTALLKETVKKGIEELLARHGMCTGDIVKILAAGMITSEFGLMPLDHIVAPAGLFELHETMHEVTLADVCEIPFVFVRGVKTDCKTLEAADMMRGEEAELFGISNEEAGVYILPGSHSKVIKTDKTGKIVDFRTMLTGEMIFALTESTILKSTVTLDEFAPDREYLLAGFHYCREHGINEALFKVRVLKNLFGRSPAEIYNFYMGVVLCDEIRYVLAQSPKAVTIGGKGALREPMAVLLRALSPAKTVTLSDEATANASAYGMVKIYEYTE